jgi:glutathione S-transferase
MSGVRLQYWDIRGLAQVPRLLLALAGVQFEDIRYTNDEDWHREKKAMNSSFPNIPALEHPDLSFTLTESKAIIQFIARSYNLYGSSQQEHALVDNIIFRAEDVRGSFTKIAYGSQDWENDKAKFIASLGQQLEPFEKLLSQRKHKWVASESISSADVFLFELFEVLSRFSPATFEALPHAVQHRDAVRALPQLQHIFAATAKLSFNGNEAHWKE